MLDRKEMLLACFFHTLLPLDITARADCCQSGPKGLDGVDAGAVLEGGGGAEAKGSKGLDMAMRLKMAGAVAMLKKRKNAGTSHFKTCHSG
jgi:hypothetical protein